MKIREYNTGDYIVDSFDNIMLLETEKEFRGERCFETDFVLGNRKQFIFTESIKRKATKDEILKYKEKYERT